MPKLKMMLCVMMLLLVVVDTHQSSLSVRCVTTIKPGVDNAASSDWQTPLERRLFHPQREADHYAKQLEGTQKYINEQCRQSCPYRWATHAIIVSNTHALPAERSSK